MERSTLLAAFSPGDWAVLGAFWVLFFVNHFSKESRKILQEKSQVDWALDVCGLLVQGVLIPLAQVLFLKTVLVHCFPDAQASLTLPTGVGFLCSFVLVDYAFYWNHRLLHGPFWALHKVHHTMSARDVLGTSRNTLWSSFFICYLWIHGVALFLLSNPQGYLWGIACTSVLDLWRHSTLDPPKFLEPWLAPWLILPQDHAWHHATDYADRNFGANLKIWDTLHKTKATPPHPPTSLGISTSLSFSRQLLWPFGEV